MERPSANNQILSKRRLFDVDFAITDYRGASEIIAENAINRVSFGVSALAVHGLVTSVSNQEYNKVLKKIDLIVPDGQPVKWALNHFYKVKLKDRVCGPELTLHVLQKCHEHSLKVYLYGSTKKTLEQLSLFIQKKYTNITICGVHEDRFRDATAQEDAEDIEKINKSGANVVLVGRGCPRQEIWVAAHKGQINSVMIAIGAAFDFHAGVIKRPSKFIQNIGMEWFYRFLQQPLKLWKRYLSTNSTFIYYVLLKSLKLRFRDE